MDLKVGQKVYIHCTHLKGEYTITSIGRKYIKFDCNADYYAEVGSDNIYAKSTRNCVGKFYLSKEIWQNENMFQTSIENLRKDIIFVSDMILYNHLNKKITRDNIDKLNELVTEVKEIIK